MKDYLKKRNQRATELYEKMKELRDIETEYNGENAELFTNVVCELSYRVAAEPDFMGKLCPKCESPISDANYDYYCSFCGQFIEK